jgi:hypothetical protein
LELSHIMASSLCGTLITLDLPLCPSPTKMAASRHSSNVPVGFRVSGFRVSGFRV